MKSASDENLSQAIERRAVTVLSLPSASGLCHHNSRLIAREGDGFSVQLPAGTSGTIDALIAAPQPVGLSFKMGANKIVFSTTVLRNSDAGVCLKWPAQLAIVQHRADHRVNLAGGTPAALRVWRISGGDDVRVEPPADSELSVKPRDLGFGGVGILTEMAAGAPAIVPGQRLRVLLGDLSEAIVLEGTVKTVRAARVSVQFEHLDEDPAKQQALTAFIHGVARRQAGGVGLLRSA